MEHTTPTSGTATHVPTVRGPVDAEDLGPVLTHEHVFVRDLEFGLNYPRLWDGNTGVTEAARRLENAWEHGVRTLVDMTVIGQGRDLGLIRRVAELTRVNIVLATGLYALDGLPQLLRLRGPGTPLGGPDPLVDLLEADVRTGIAGSGVRAALVKFVCEKTEDDATVRRLAAAAAEVHRRTGVPVVVHTEPANTSAMKALTLLGDLGVDPHDVVLAHAGDIADPGYLRELAASGAYLGCDRFGMAALGPDDQRIATVAALLVEGHIDQVLLSQDCPAFIDHVTEEQRAQLNPDWDYAHLHSRVVPRLLAEGVSEKEIDALFVANPRRLLTAAARRAGAA
ncbi:phosphotriesterase family protein [Streptomyces hoynatensis]|uniref:Phosphotriesterase-related protein n=1 Tax=Streptomyces hoynatensis TaxID=1141874 RepID=A0A3A9ZF61_9ACTN|nr:phosphotriesterase-related protein [Streptomyces hoynatensis]RKN47031.1 phosphotriesterase-related protein [Streptomyces hoynatensis]